jgi:outer membrane protein TolC
MPPAACLVALLMAVLVSPAVAQSTGAPPLQRLPGEWTLEGAVTAALAQHPLIEAAVARLEAARGERDGNAALPNPVGTFWMENARYPGQDAAFNLARETSIYLTYPIEALFQRGPRARRSDEEVQAAESLLRLVRRRIAADTVGAFFAVALAQVLHEEGARTVSGLSSCRLQPGAWRRALRPNESRCVCRSS